MVLSVQNVNCPECGHHSGNERFGDVINCVGCESLVDVRRHAAAQRLSEGECADRTRRQVLYLPTGCSLHPSSLAQLKSGRSPYRSTEFAESSCRVEWRWRGDTHPSWGFLWGTLLLLLLAYITIEMASLNPIAGLLVPFPGLALIYLLVAKYVNRTMVSVEHGELKVKTRPLPLRPARQFSAKSIDQIWVEPALGTGVAVEVERPCFAVFSLVHSHQQVQRMQLLQEVSHLDAALWLEQKLEAHLGIEDRPVRGEVFVLPGELKSLG